MDKRFLHAAAVQSAPRLIGVQLRPFSLWHAACLMLLDSPYIAVGREPDDGDFLSALMVCADGRDDALSSWRQLERSRIRRFVLSFRLAMAGDRARQAFSDWLLAQIAALPEVYRDPGSAHTSAVPWPFHVVVALLSRFHHFRGEAEAWDTPAATAICYVTALAEWTGAKVVDPEDDERAERAMAALEAAQGKDRHDA